MTTRPQLQKHQQFLCFLKREHGTVIVLTYLTYRAQWSL